MGFASAQAREVNTVSSPGVISPRMMNRPPTKMVISVMALARISMKG